MAPRNTCASKPTSRALGGLPFGARTTAGLCWTVAESPAEASGGSGPCTTWAGRGSARSLRACGLGRAAGGKEWEEDGEDRGGSRGRDPGAVRGAARWWGAQACLLGPQVQAQQTQLCLVQGTAVGSWGILLWGGGGETGTRERGMGRDTLPSVYSGVQLAAGCRNVVPGPPRSHPPNGAAALWSLQVLGGAGAPARVGEDARRPLRAPPAPLPSAAAGWLLSH